MSEVTVESLPEDVLVEVFKWLDMKSLKNVMLTCQQWSYYVRRSHQWTLNLIAALPLGNAEAQLESVLMANRKYNKMVIKGWRGMDGGKILEFLEKHGVCIHELTITWSRLTNASIWCNTFNTMPNLKKIKMTDTTWDESVDDVTDDELPPLHKLKTLELNGNSNVALKLFKKCQLYTMNVNTLRNYLDDQSREEFWNFLATQKDLKELNLDSGSCSTLFETPVTGKSMPFLLKKLSLTYPFIEMPTNSINNLMEFMKLHKNTLEDLGLHLKFPENFYEFVFTLDHLKTLSLSVFDIQQDSVERLKVNESVTSLKLNFFGWAFNALAAKSFVSRLPNVQKLMVNGSYDILLAEYIADNMKKLKKLDVDCVEAKTFDEARFPALKSRRICRLDGPINWFAFAKNNPSINELCIGDVVKPIYLDVTGITRNLKLRQLTIESSELDCNEKFFEVIRQNCPELKSLELNEKSLKVDISTVADIPGLRFCKF